jgi:glyoxylase-like metal-dependent hydrolase (beta-lactamase superfamily II)
MSTFVENEVREVGQGVWVRVAVDNIAWVDLGRTSVGDGVAVIDALEDPTQADVIRGHIKDTTGKDLKWIVQTHWDADHIACNPQWKREGAIAIAHASCADAAGNWEGRPDISYDDKATLRGSDETIVMQWVGGTHTPWDTVLYFPRARVLHIADIFGWGLIPCLPTSEKVTRLRTVLDHILSYNADTVICGHGPTLTLDHIRRFRTYFEEMLETVSRMHREGKTIEQIEAAVPAPADMADWWRFNEWKHARNITLIVDNYSAV